MVIISMIIFTAFPVWGITGTVTKVHSGEMVYVSYGSEQRPVYLYGINIPEISETSAKLSKINLAHLISGLKVTASIQGSYQKNKISVILYQGNTCINESMIKSGYAQVDENLCTIPICQYWKRLENKAKVARKGLWQNQTTQDNQENFFSYIYSKIQ